MLEDLINNPKGNQLKDVKSKLSYDAYRYSKSPDPADQDFGDALQDIKRNFMLHLAKQNGPIHRALIRADKAEEDYIRMADAFASRTSGTGFTPKELGQSIRRQAPSRIAFAEGPNNWWTICCSNATFVFKACNAKRYPSFVGSPPASINTSGRGHEDYFSAFISVVRKPRRATIVTQQNDALALLQPLC